MVSDRSSLYPHGRALWMRETKGTAGRETLGHRGDRKRKAELERTGAFHPGSLGWHNPNREGELMGDHRPATWEGGGKKSVRAQTVGQPAPAEPEPQVAEATDAAKALAAQHNIDLAFVPGTGAGGQITKGDVQAVLPEPEPVPEPIPDEAEIPPEEPAAEAEPPIEEPVAEAEVPAEQA